MITGLKVSYTYVYVKMSTKGAAWLLHLPKEIRQRIAYAAAALVLTGGILYAARPAVPESTPLALESIPTATATPAGESLTDLIAPMKKAPAGATVDAAALVAVQAEPEPAAKFQEYTVVSGDIIGNLADRFGLKSQTILDANDMSANDYLTVGQTLIIPRVDGIIHEVRRGDTLWDIAVETGVDQDEIIQANPEVDPSALQIGQTLLIPGAEPSRRGMVASARGSVGSRTIRTFDNWPTYGPVTSEFGNRVHPVYGTSHFHDGLDLGVSSGTPLRAVSGGSVTLAGWFGGYGITVRIDHGNGIVTQYAHMSSVEVSNGQRVDANQLIGYSGNTGVSTGPHLHFMVIQGGTPVDPWPWLP